METITAAHITDDIILEKQGRSELLTAEGAHVTLGRVKGTVALASVTVKVDDRCTTIEAKPIGGRGKSYSTDIITCRPDEDTIRQYAQEALDWVVRLNNWVTVFGDRGSSLSPNKEQS